MNPNPLRSALPFLLLTLAIIQPSLSSLALPGLHIERVKIGTTTSPTPYTYSAAGHDFTHTWRTTLPAVLQIAMALNEYQVEANSYLSYEVTIPTTNTTGMTYNIKPSYLGVKIDYMSFSVIVITENSQLFELVEELVVTPLSSSYYYVGSSKYDLSAPGIKYMLMYQQIVAVELTASTTSLNFWTYFSSSVTNPSNSSQIRYLVRLSSSSFISAKILVLFVNSTSKVFYKSQIYYIGSRVGRLYFQINYEIDTSIFGEPVVSETCLFGISYIDYYYSSTATALVNFLYNYTGNQIIGLIDTTANYQTYTQALCIQLFPSANQTPSSPSQSHDTLIIGVAVIILLIVIAIFSAIIVVIKNKAIATVHVAKQDFPAQRPSHSKMKSDVELVQKEPYSQAETSSNRIDNPRGRFKKTPTLSYSGMHIMERFK